MKIFLLDLLHDLREKRMWPVALVLVLALVAVPVVLSKPAADPPPPAAEPVDESAKQQDLKGLARVVLADQEQGKGSKLNLFDSGNPFSPPESVKKQKKKDAADLNSPAGTDTGTGAGLGTSVGDTVGGSLGGGSTGSTGGAPGGGTTSPAPPVVTKPKTTQFTYVIDLTFKNGDNKPRRIKGMQRLEMLPNENAPLLLFLGVDAKANNAVFLVDSRLKPTGEGKCKPTPDDCSFLYLGAGSEEVFTDPDGNTYTLQVQEIRKIKVSKKNPKAKAGKNNRSSTRKAKTSQYNRKTAQEQRRPFLPQLLTDLVSVTANPSSTAGKSR